MFALIKNNNVTVKIDNYFITNLTNIKWIT